MAPQTEQKDCFPAQIAGVWAQRVTLRMCEENGEKDGDMLATRGPLHSTVSSKVGVKIPSKTPYLYACVPDQA